MSEAGLEVVSLIRWCYISDYIFACKTRRLKYNHEYVKDSLDTVDESGAVPVPLCELVEGLHYSEMQTSELQEQLSS